MLSECRKGGIARTLSAWGKRKSLSFYTGTRQTCKTHWFVGCSSLFTRMFCLAGICSLCIPHMFWGFKNINLEEWNHLLHCRQLIYEKHLEEQKRIKESIWWVHEKIFNLSVQKLFCKNTEHGLAMLRTFLIKACGHKHLNTDVLLKKKYSKSQVSSESCTLPAQNDRI